MDHRPLFINADEDIYVDLVQKDENQKKTSLKCYLKKFPPILLVVLFCTIVISFLAFWFFFYGDEDSTVLSRKIRDVKSYCPDDYFFFPQTGFCYKHYHTPALFMKAEEKCQSEGGHIASIHSEQEHSMLHGLFLSALKRERESYESWIGLHTIDGKWTWTDGSKVDYLSWKPGFGVTDGKTNFAYSNAFVFEWYKTDKYQKVFTCKRPSTVKVSPKDYLKYTPCTEGYLWFEHTEQCYKVISPETTFENATKMCKEDEATIASVHSAIENMFLMGLAIKHRDTSRDDDKTLRADNIWIGMNDGMKTWQDGSSVDYRNWGHGQPADNKKHVKITIKSGKWITEGWTDLAICKKY